MTASNLPPHILIVEDDLELAQWMQSYLEKKGYRVSLLMSGLEAVSFIEQHQPDLVVLDGMLPDLDGFDVCKQVRASYANAIIMVTARDEEIDEVLGLEMGADDYLTKPVRARALLARIKKHLVKQQDFSSQRSNSGTTLRFNQLIIDQQNRQVCLGDTLIKVSSHEFELLWYLAIHAGQVISRAQLISELRGFDYDGFDRSVDLKVSRLRKKLGDNASEPTRIKTIWGKGYLFVKEAW